MMYCQKCGNKISEGSKFCEKCGVKVGDAHVSYEKKVDTQPVSDKKGKSSSHWLLWWEIGKEELQKQVDGYHTMTMTESARGLSVLALLFSSTLTVLFIAFGGWSSGSYVDVGLFLVLAFFIYSGQSWAMIGAMILWTVEKGYSIYSATTSDGSSGYIIFISLLWWATYMHAFWLAYKVEVEMKKVNEVTQNAPQIN
jgi:hypothetical protein